MSTTSYPNSLYDSPQQHQKKNKKKSGKNNSNKGTQTIQRQAPPPPMWLLEACVTPETANSPKWLTDFMPMATQLLLSNRPAYLIVRNSWNPVPFEHYPSQPATCLLTTSEDDKYVSTDAKVWTPQEIRATVEDCDFVSGNMWFYIPTGAPRSPDDLFENVIAPLLEWNRAPTGVGEIIASAEDALALLYWNAPGDVIHLGAEELKKIARRLGIVIENEDAMVIDCLEEDFSATATSPDDVDEEGPRRIPLFDWFWVGIALIVLQLVYLASKFDFFRDWFSF
ncbi:hypothetical protein GCK72_020831 [Caenorhabditis remanei]|uniref:Uncharacterized protein n=1 Tax=Caenorhabditis remanei TaxID=31234 RepID=A0A6A5GI46_CAERE|nr:hypothetical protein GCK72_020831 [Caenorhabditis remanei]KAF1754271.1 hypothetical protein GCK72_020831 [Caenorhabditis remanei]